MNTTTTTTIVDPKRLSQHSLCLFDDKAERITKKARTTIFSMLDIVEQLAEVATVKYNLGEYQTAEQFFFQALCFLDGQYYATSKGERNQSNSNKSIEYDEGMRVYNNLLPIRINMNTSSSSSEDNAPALLCYNIAQTYVQRHAYENAMTWFDKSLLRLSSSSPKPAVRNCNLSSSSLHVVMNLSCLGYCNYRLGKHHHSKLFYQRALSSLTTMTRPNNNVAPSASIHLHHVAAALNCYGVMLFNDEECDTVKAMEMFSQSLELYKTDNEDDASSTDHSIAIATVLNNIGRVLYMRSEFDDAKKVYSESLQLRRILLGSRSVDVAATLYNIGQTCQHMGDFNDALTCYQEFLNILLSGSSGSPTACTNMDMDTVLAYKAMGEIYQLKLDFKTSLKYFSMVLNKQQRNLENTNVDAATDIAATLNRMGNLHYELHQYKDALVRYQEGLRVEKSVLKPNHPHIIITMTNIGHIHKHLGDYKKALASYQHVDSMQILSSDDGVDNFTRAENLSSIGLMQYYLREYELSFNSYQEALRVRRLHLGNDDHPDIASTLNSIGLVLFKQDVFDLAKQCFSESLRIRSKLLGKDHRDVATLWYNIATIHFETGEDDVAIQMYDETLRIERIALGEDHQDVALTLQHLGQVHQQIGRLEESLKYFQKAVSIERRKQNLSGNIISLAKNLNLLGNLYLQLGMISEMMECYVEASRIYESNGESEATLVIGGYNLYGLSKTNPPCAPLA